MKFVCSVDVRFLMTGDQNIREELCRWLKSLAPWATVGQPSAPKVIAALEQAVCQQQPASGAPQPQRPPKPEPAVETEPTDSKPAAVKVETPADAHVALLKDGRISQSTLELFDLSSVLKNEDASALLLDESKLAHMPPDKVSCCSLSLVLTNAMLHMRNYIRLQIGACQSADRLRMKLVHSELVSVQIYMGRPC